MGEINAKRFYLMLNSQALRALSLSSLEMFIINGGNQKFKMNMNLIEQFDVMSSGNIFKQILEEVVDAIVKARLLEVLSNKVIHVV